MKKALLTLALLVSGSVFAECDMQDLSCGPIVQPDFSTELACTMGVDCVQDNVKTIACDDPSCMGPVNVACSDPSCLIAPPVGLVPSFCDPSDPNCSGLRVACDNPSCEAPVKVVCSDPSCEIAPPVA